jgi:adenylate cyclase
LEQSTTDQLTPIRNDDYGIFLTLAVLSVLVAMAIVRRTRSLLSMGVNAVLDSERARQRLGMYVSETIADQAMASAELKPGGQRQEVAILFSDLRDFTRYSEGLSPEQLVQELNAYLEAMLNEISAEGGVVDKYIGDAIMVVFGLPRARPDDAARAIRTAIRMQDALTRHNQDRATQGQPPYARA